MSHLCAYVQYVHRGDACNVRFTVVRKPHECPLHNLLPIVEQKVKRLTQRITNMRKKNEGDAELPKLEAQLKRLITKPKGWEELQMHVKHYENQRAYLTKRTEQFPNGGAEVVLYVDFVCQYASDGSKSRVLVFAIVYRDDLSRLRVRFLDTVCADREINKVKLVNKEVPASGASFLSNSPPFPRRCLFVELFFHERPPSC